MWTIFMLLLLLPSAALAQGSYTLTTTAAQETLLTDVLAGVNAARAAETPPRAALTKEQYIRSLVAPHLLQWRQQQRENAIKAAGEGEWAALTVQQKTAICASLALSPCPQ